MSPEDRAARRGRDRTVSSVVEAAQRAWGARAERLEQLGLRMVEEASAHTETVQAPALDPVRLKAGLELLDAADKIWLRLGRVLPRAAGGPAAAAGPATSLDAYRTRRPRVG